MERTRRFWTEASIGGFLAVLAGLFGRPVLLLGTVGIAATLLGQLYVFSRAVAEIDNHLTIEHAVSSPSIRVGEPLLVTLEVTFPYPAPVGLVIDPVPPVTARLPSEADLRIELAAGQRSAQRTVPIEWSVAGTFEFEPTRVQVTDSFGLFTEELSRDPELSVAVDTHRHRVIHVGRGGGRDVNELSGTSAGRRQPGIEPIEVREYVPGDTLRRIDWNATARLNRPHVREYETETERSVMLILDHRFSVGSDATGATSFDFLRTVALGVVAAAQERKDLLSLVTVGEAGITTMIPPRATKQSFGAIRRHLLSLDAPSRYGDDAIRSIRQRWSPERADRAVTTLADDDGPFGRVLRAYFETPSTTLRGGAQDSLSSIVPTLFERYRAPSTVMVLTTDDDREELRRAVDRLRGRGSEVYAFIAPRVLFEPLGSIENGRLRSQYRGFESFRRELDRRGGVTAFEVGPADRLATIRSPEP